jgi:hypothetical protein
VRTGRPGQSAIDLDLDFALDFASGRRQPTSPDYFPRPTSFSRPCAILSGLVYCGLAGHFLMLRYSCQNCLLHPLCHCLDLLFEGLRR